MRPLLLAIVLVGAGCLAPSVPSPQDSGVATRTLDEGPQSGVAEPLRSVVSNETEWAALWERHASMQVPPPERPAVDFATERVLAVSLGEKNDGCWSVSVDSVTRTGTEIVAVVTTTDSHGAGGACIEVITHPHHFVAIRDTTAAVRFDERLHKAPSTSPQPTPDAAEPLSARAIDRGSFSGIHEDAYDFVAIPDRAGEVRFVEREEAGTSQPVTAPSRSAS